MTATNRLILIGYVGGVNPLKTLQDGTPVLGFSVAQTMKRKGGEKTQWFDVGLFGKRAEALQPFIRKGDPICVQGPVTLDMYTANDGTTKAALKVFANEVDLLSQKPPEQPRQNADYNDPNGNAATQPPMAQQAAAHQGQYPSHQQANTPPQFDDDIPF